ncbi:GNAT family N-acetyltransferase [Leptospira stimsonii]|uniref:GNAT family N-acetyltransferase n=1 Tax=Leptospira stimsonii TaxID=2202203 RepID=A0ABY2NB16_9LEPT|nr:GNAT family N-acetyltransferase [Leptospira stimsonii]TGK20361.1 GNAT family N-acetyltransferase [Leptospira stimsonii]TGM20411.1 GNAT family N-acetyltransferase [Leptospira stimsonii]
MEFRLITFAQAFAEGFTEQDVDLDVWPFFLNQDPIGKEYYHFIVKEFPSLHCVALTSDRRVAGTGKILPFNWNEKNGSLPKGWGATILQGVADHKEGKRYNAASAWSIEILPEFRGSGLSHRILSMLKKNARSRNILHLFACVRPNQKEKFPFLSMKEYLEIKREDGLSEDPWIRVHEKAGGKQIGIEETSMYIQGTVAEWEEWTNLKFPESGAYAIPGGLVPVLIDRDADLGEYVEPNVWFHHRTNTPNND